MDFHDEDDDDEILPFAIDTNVQKPLNSFIFPSTGNNNPSSHDHTSCSSSISQQLITSSHNDGASSSSNIGSSILPSNLPSYENGSNSKHHEGETSGATTSTSRTMEVTSFTSIIGDEEGSSVVVPPCDDLVLFKDDGGAGDGRRIVTPSSSLLESSSDQQRMPGQSSDDDNFGSSFVAHSDDTSSPLNSNSSEKQQQVESNMFSESVMDAISSSLDFSQLMEEADNSNSAILHQPNCKNSLTASSTGNSSTPPLPPISESPPSSPACNSADTPPTSNRRRDLTPTGFTFWDKIWGAASPAAASDQQKTAGRMTTPTQTGNMQLTSLSSSSAIPTHIHPQTNNIDHSHYQQGVGSFKGISTERLSQDSFRVTTVIRSPCTVRDVVDAASDPDLLKVWCDPVTTVYVTSDGRAVEATTASSSSLTGAMVAPGLVGVTERKDTSGAVHDGREYDGEWIEATTSTLVAPPSHTSCAYRCLNTTKTYLGFPSHGTVNMFVERNRGRVGMTIGPYGGGVMAYHTLTATANTPADTLSSDGDAGVTVVDTVRISRERDVDFTGGCGITCCGLGECMDGWYLPGLAGYMGQTASSLGKLRDLVEFGGQEVIAAASSSTMEGATFLFGRRGDAAGEDHDGARVPLLG